MREEQSIPKDRRHPPWNCTSLIATPGTTSCQEFENEEVLICPGDEIYLCWNTSSDVVSVKLDPGAIALPANGFHRTTPPGAADLIYRVTTVGGNYRGRRHGSSPVLQGRRLDRTLLCGRGWK